jgi:hypothetical protein
MKLCFAQKTSMYNFEAMVGITIYFFSVDAHMEGDTDLVGLDLLVDVKEADLMHDGQLGYEVDDRYHQVDRECERGIVRVVCAQQEPMLVDG